MRRSLNDEEFVAEEVSSVFVGAKENLENAAIEEENVIEDAANSETPALNEAEGAEDANAKDKNDESVKAMPEPMVEGISADSDDEPPVIKKKSIRKVKEPSKAKRVKAEPKASAKIIENIGSYSNDIREEYDNRKSAQEELNEHFQKLASAKKNHLILWGRMIKSGMESVGSKVMAMAYVDWNGIEVRIPADYYFEPNFSFGKTFEDNSDIDKERRKLINLNYQFNAIVCFVPIGLSRTKDKGSDEEIISCIGNRVEAMRLVRKSIFGKENAVKVGDVCRHCHILSVKAAYVLAEVCGVETTVPLFQLSNRAAEADRADQLIKVGDTVSCTIKSISISGKGESVKLVVTFRDNTVSSAIKNMKKEQNILGIVDHYNPEKETYTILLSNGVKGSCHKKDVEGGIPLVQKQSVTFHVFNVYDTHVSGSCKKR